MAISIIVTNEANPRDPARQRRGIEAVKARGSALLPGLHRLTRGSTGMIVYPRLESRVATDSVGVTDLSDTNTISDTNAVSAANDITAGNGAFLVIRQARLRWRERKRQGAP